MIKVLGKNYKIKFVSAPLKDDAGDEAIALFDPKDASIKMTDPISIKVLIHEIVHSLHDRLPFEVDPKTEELLAESIALVITENFEIMPSNLSNYKYIKGSEDG